MFFLKYFRKCFYAFMRVLIMPWFATFGHYRWQVYKPRSRTYIVLTNHNTNYDFFLTGLSFRRHMYYVASESILRKGFAGRLVKFFADPIPRRKGASGQSAADEILRRLRAGDNVCMAVEGNRSFSGESGWVSGANAPLIRESGAGLITYRIHGGYLESPRWSKTQRPGPIWGETVREYTPEEIAGMTDDEITAAIRSGIYVNAYEDQAQCRRRYRSKAPAENLETALFLCPECHAFSSLHSAGSSFACQACGMQLSFDEYGYFTAQAGGKPPFTTVLDWSRWQTDFLRTLLPQEKGSSAALFADDQLELYVLGDGQAKEKIGTGRLTLCPDRLCFHSEETALEFPLAEITHMSIFLTNTLLFTASGSYYEVKSGTHYSALKYLICWRLLIGKDYV